MVISRPLDWINCTPLSTSNCAGIITQLVIHLSHPLFTPRTVSRYNRAMPKILVVDDEPPIIDVLVYNLKQSGYDTVIARDGEQAVTLAKREQPDLIILDLMLPKIDGLEVYRIVRRDSDVPVIMLTARDAEIDRVVGLELGADDYVVKPFSVRELMVRVKNVLRRSIPRPIESAAPDRICVDALTLDVARHEARWGNDLIELTALEFAMLHTLARHADQVLSREQLLELVWGYDYHDDLRVVDAVIKRLRAKLREAALDVEDHRHRAWRGLQTGLAAGVVVMRRPPSAISRRLLSTKPATRAFQHLPSICPCPWRSHGGPLGAIDGKRR